MPDAAARLPAGGTEAGEPAPPPEQAAAPGQAAPADEAARLRSPTYARLLLLAALVGVPISAAAYFFLQLVDVLQQWVYVELPPALGFATTPLWWPLPALAVAGVLVSLTISRLRRRGGHSPVDGFAAELEPAQWTCRACCSRPSRASHWERCSGRRRR